MHIICIHIYLCVCVHENQINKRRCYRVSLSSMRSCSLMFPSHSQPPHPRFFPLFLYPRSRDLPLCFLSSLCCPL